MAIARKQNPKDSGVIIHQLRYPTFYTALSTSYTERRMRYDFKLNTVDGEVHNSLIPPSITEGYGIYSSTPIMYNLTDFTFNPKITQPTKVNDLLVNYRVDINEHNTDDTTLARYPKVIGIRSEKEDFNYEKYILNGLDKYPLTEWTESPREVRLNDYGTLRLLAGIFGYEDYNGIPTPIKSWFYKIRLTHYDNNGNTYFYESSAENPYFNNTHSIGVSNDNEILENLDEYVLDIPSGAKNVQNTEWVMSGYLDAGGSYTPTPAAIPTVGIEQLTVGDEYDIQAFVWPQGDNGRTSAPIRFKVIDECRTDYCQIAWENRVGGVEYLTVTMNKYLSIKVEKSTYLQNKYSQGYDGKPSNVGYNQYSRGETNFYNKTAKKYTIYTDWVDDTQIEEMKTLWDSKNVYLRIDEDWIPIIITNTEVSLQNDARGLRNYEINIALSNKQYR